VSGVKAVLQAPNAAASLAVKAVERRKVRIDVSSGSSAASASVLIELPRSWPGEDIHVTDLSGEPVAVQRDGIRWHRLVIPAPPGRSSYFVQASRPAKDTARRSAEQERAAQEPTTGLTATLCKWCGGKRSALCIRFDDSHPTHISRAIPILREYGLRATFMINPGRPAYQKHRPAWEACAQRGDQEFGNHTMQHRGAASDEEADRQIGAASEYIWSIFPGRSKLLAVNLGGGTKWRVAGPLRHYLDRYHLFHAIGSLGMDDGYGKRVAAFRQHLERNIQRGGWCKAHFHYIGDGLSTSEANFRAAMDVVKEHEAQVWVAGLADAFKYLTERGTTKLSLKLVSPRQVALHVSCGTDPTLYDHPLTVEITLPSAWESSTVVVKRAASDAVIHQSAPVEGRGAVRLDVPPIAASYTIERAN